MRPLDRLHRLGEGARNPAEGVVQLGAREVDADGHLVEARALELLHQLPRQAVGRRRDRGHAQAFRLAAAHELEEVGSVDRVAPAQDQDRRAHRRHLVDQVEPLRGRELARIAAGLGRGTAVAAGERARLGGFPDDEERRLGEVDSAGRAGFLSRARLRLRADVHRSSGGCGGHGVFGRAAATTARASRRPCRARRAARSPSPAGTRARRPRASSARPASRGCCGCGCGRWRG